MDWLQKGRGILSDAESRLHQVASDALANRDYDAARWLLNVAHALADLNPRDGKADPQPPAESAHGEPTRPKDFPYTPGPKPDPAPSAAPPPTSSPSQAAASMKSTKKRPTVLPPSNTNAYPRFVRQEDRLIKIGFSKRSGEEYEHKAPKSAVFAFAAHLLAHTRPGRVFSMDKITPVPDVEHPRDLPDYQVYLTLAWLRALGIASKHGRSGYSFDHAQLTSDALADHWSALPIPTVDSED